MDQARINTIALQTFCSSSGQKISMEKTRVYFSKNVARQTRILISDELGFHMTNDLGKYLDIPLFHSRVGLNTLNFMIDKVAQRLSNWKSKTLSFAQRVTFAKSVLQAIRTYTMQSTFLPRGICDQIDQLCRSFI